MKFLWPVFLLMFACGKKPQDVPIYKVDPESLYADSDGDGMLDWDEKYAGRDPFLADVDESLPEASGSATLLDENSREVILPFIAHRSLRESLIRQISLGKPQAHPISNELILRMDHQSSFWRAKLDNFKFQRIRLPVVGYEDARAIDATFNGRIKIPTKTARNLLEKVETHTYRLVVSTSNKDYIFHLATNVKPLEFLQKKFFVRLDVMGKVVQIDEWEQTVAHVDSIDYQHDIALWQAVNIPLNLKANPKAGETYALIHASAGEFAAAGMGGVDSTHLERTSRHILYSHKTSVIVFIPALTKFIWKNENVSYGIPTGNGDRDRGCNFTLNSKIGYRAYSIGPTELIKLIDLGVAQDVNVKWIEQSEVGAAARIEMFLPKGEANFGFSEDFMASQVAIGITKSDCGLYKPVKFTKHPQWQNPRGDFHWLPER